ncbi:hypothetical protein [Singulisphaera acidiphila]|uniref:hypothetical protein n=1 Tax=Singulisphaera acidiphila TaxID=466153 RepID=UPI0012B5066B|nr:hypothetical protein [Singulisphaera acidiphila]
MSTRVGNQVISRYEGDGLLGQMVAELERLARAKREEERWADRLMAEAFAADERQLADYHRSVELIFRASMENAGYHRHSRGEWRMGRPKKTELKTTAAAPVPAKDPRDFTHKEMVDIVHRAGKNDKTVLPELRKLLDSSWREIILDFAGDPATILSNRYRNRFVGSDGGLAMSHAMEARLEQLAKSLTPPDATPLEKLLVSRVVTCWMAVHEAEYLETNGLSQNTPRACEILMRRVERAHNRFLSSVKALATVRKLSAVPTTVSMSRTETVTVETV